MKVTRTPKRFNGVRLRWPASVVVTAAVLVALSGCFSAQEVIFAPDGEAMEQRRLEAEDLGLDAAGEVLGACSSASSLGEVYNYALFLRGASTRADAVELLTAQGFEPTALTVDNRDELLREGPPRWYAAVITVDRAKTDQRDSDCEPVELEPGDTIVLLNTQLE